MDKERSCPVKRHQNKYWRCQGETSSKRRQKIEPSLSKGKKIARVFYRLSVRGYVESAGKLRSKGAKETPISTFILTARPWLSFPTHLGFLRLFSSCNTCDDPSLYSFRRRRQLCCMRGRRRHSRQQSLMPSDQIRFFSVRRLHIDSNTFTE